MSTRACAVVAWLSSVSVALAGCRIAAAPRPLLPSAALSRAACHSEAGEDGRALQVLAQVLCQPPGSVALSPAVLERKLAVLSAWVRTWDVTGREEAERHRVQACLQKDALGPLAQMMLADATGAWDEVVALGERALPGAEPPVRGELLLRHAVATMHQGRTARAVALLTEAISEAPEQADLYVALAQGREALGMYDAVRPALLPLLQLQRPPQPALLARARGILNAAREAAAPPLTRADLAENVDLTNVAASAEIGPEDLAHVRRLATTTQQPRLLSLCALVLLRAGDTATGRTLLQRASDALPMDPDPIRLLAAHRLTDHDWDGALSALAEAVRRDPFDVEAQLLLANVAARVGQHAVAARAFGALVRLEPAVPAHHAGLWRALAAAGLAPEAAVSPGSRAQAFPDDETVRPGKGAAPAAVYLPQAPVPSGHAPKPGPGG